MSPRDILADTIAIVVHHNSPNTLAPTLRALAESGLPSQAILVVDNSTNDVHATTSEAIAGTEFLFLHAENRGYAAAVNDGLAYLSDRGLSRTFTIVATHESVAETDAVSLLRAALVNDPEIAVTGPTLINADSEDGKIWSTGGTLSRLLKLPTHDRNTLSSAPGRIVDRDWLDGAFTMYRTALLEQFPLDEGYFLYFEETDLHTRLRGAGYRIVWVPQARVFQRSSGIPPLLMGRNLFLFHTRHFSPTRGRLAVGYQTFRALIRAALTSRGQWSASRDILSGWAQGERIAQTTDFANTLTIRSISVRIEAPRG